MDQDNLRYFSLLLRRWWLIVLAAVLAGGISYFLRINQTPSYRAQALISVGNFIEQANPTSGQLNTSEELARNYAQLIRTASFLEPVIETLSFDVSINRLRGMVSASLVQNTTYLAISASNSNPERAAEIANAVAQRLDLTNAASLSESDRNTLEVLNNSIDVLETEIEELISQRDEIDAQILDAEGTRALLLNEERTQIINQFLTANQTKADFIQSRMQILQRLNDIEIIDPARVPTSATGISPRIIAITGALVGAIFAVAVILFFEYVDNTIRTSDEASALVRLPVLGTIVRSKQLARASKSMANQQGRMKSLAVEGYRNVQTNLLFSPQHHESKRSFIILSARPGEGRSITAANMAVNAAEAGLRVLLIDADFNKPVQHEIFGLKNEIGLADLLTRLGSETDLMERASEQAFLAVMNEYIQETRIANLCIMTSGMSKGERVTSILGFESLSRCMEIIQAAAAFDLVLLDSASALSSADSFVLAAVTKANVLLVIEAGRTPRSAVQKVAEQLGHLGNNVSGIILNRVSPRNI